MSALMLLRREVGHGGRIPRGWRMAWYEPKRRVGVYYPPPMHWLLRVWREIAYRVRLALRAPLLERAQSFELQRANHQRRRLAEEYANGYMAGWQECYAAWLDTFEEECSRSGDIWELGASLLDAANEGHEN
jgi:hypothetical protein